MMIIAHAKRVRTSVWALLAVCAMLDLMMPLAMANAQIIEAYGGYDRAQPVAGCWYSLSDDFSLLVEYMGDKPLGLGLYYRASPWSAEITSVPSYSRLSLTYEPIGSLRIQTREATGNILGNISLRVGGLRVSGYLDNLSQETRGYLALEQDWAGGNTSLAWKDPGSSADTQSVTVGHKMRIGGNSLEATGLWELANGLEGLDKPKHLRLTYRAGLPLPDSQWTSTFGFQNGSDGKKTVTMTQDVILPNHSAVGTTVWRFDEGGDSQRNVGVSYQFKGGGNQLEVSILSNEFGSGAEFVGNGGEVLWSPPPHCLGLGFGLFSETTTGASASRYRARVAKTISYQSGSTLLKVGGGVEDYLYSSGDNRLELSAHGSARLSRDNGYFELRLRGINRHGTTPFRFDNIPERIGLNAEFQAQQRFGSVVSDFTASYNVTAQKLDVAKGSLQLPLSDAMVLNLTANHDAKSPSKPGSTTYAVDVLYQGPINVRAHLLIDPQFKPTEFYCLADAPLARHRLVVDGLYSFRNQQLKTISALLELNRGGSVRLECEPAIPRVILTYRPARW